MLFHLVPECFHSVVARAATVTLVTTHHPFIKPNFGVPSWNRNENCAPSLTFLPVRGCGCDLEAGRTALHPRDVLGLDGTFYFIHFRERKTECAQAGEGQDRERTPSRPSPPPQAEWEACVGPRVRSHNLSRNQTWPLARRCRPAQHVSPCGVHGHVGHGCAALLSRSGAGMGSVSTSLHTLSKGNILKYLEEIIHKHSQNLHLTWRLGEWWQHTHYF